MCRKSVTSTIERREAECAATGVAVLISAFCWCPCVCAHASLVGLVLMKTPLGPRWESLVSRRWSIAGACQTLASAHPRDPLCLVIDQLPLV